MAVSLNTTLRNSRADAITTFAGNGAKLRIYTAGAVQIVECVCGTPFAAAASSGVLTLSAISQGTAGATGTATNASIYKADGTTLIVSGLSVGTSASNVNLSSTLITTGDNVAISSATITEGNA